MGQRWIAIVTRTDARIFTARPFKRVIQLRNPLGRAKNREMMTDKPPVSRGAFAGAKGLHAVSEKNPHEDAAVAFAKRVAEYLRKSLAQNKFGDLTLVAEPKMLGRVKSELDKNVLAVTECVRKDLGNMPPPELTRALNLRARARA